MYTDRIEVLYHRRYAGHLVSVNRIHDFPCGKDRFFIFIKEELTNKFLFRKELFNIYYGEHIPPKEFWSMLDELHRKIDEFIDSNGIDKFYQLCLE